MADFVRVAAISELPDPGKLFVEVDDEMVALFHVEGSFYAIDDVCTHDSGPLVDGELNGFKIACPRHGAKFDIRTGSALTMPAVRSTRAHDVKVENGSVWVRLRAVGVFDGPISHAGAGAHGFEVTRSKMLTDVADSSMPTAALQTVAVSAADSVPALSLVLCEDAVREMLKEVKDPELFVNIVDLGLIYGVTLSPTLDAPGKQQVVIAMTMTSPACPAGPQLIADTKRAVGAHGDVSAVEVRIVMDPPWTPDRMTDAARDQLGIF
ncbi:MAG: hypothetical protein CK530_00855 [Planctomycetaceae bacterium]|nr:MAG: hypothetical protein CK530_00855 [Planctomycetaceae bacterium]